MTMPTLLNTPAPTALVLGLTGGYGHAMAAELLRAGYTLGRSSAIWDEVAPPLRLCRDRWSLFRATCWTATG